MRTPVHAAALTSFVALCLVGFTGCSSTFESTSDPVQTPFGEIHGSVFGGRQPIVGAHVYVYAAGAGPTNTPTPSVSLLKSYTTGSYPTQADANGNYYVVTDSGGNFGLTGEYSCTSGQQLYIYAPGGQPTPNVTNNAAANMAILGNCPSSGTLAGQISFINLNEISTVAAAYAFAGFATDPTHVSAPNNTLAQKGLFNAFANAANLYNIQIPGNSSALATTPGGNGTVPQKEINSLGNSLAACVNSSGASSTECTALFGAVKSAGATGTTAIDTATFAIYLAHHPRVSATAVSTIYTQAAKIGSPYFPLLASAPSDWTISLIFTGGSIGQTGGESPHDVAVDNVGNIYTTNFNGNNWSKFNYLGVPANAGGFGDAMNEPGSVAIDANSTHVWLVNYGNRNISRFAVDGTAETEYGVARNNLQDAQIDGSGNIWITTNGEDGLVKMTSSGVTLSTNANAVNSPFALAIEPGLVGDIWVTNETGNNVSRLSNANAAYRASPYRVGGVNGTIGAAIDANGYAWFTNGDGSVSKVIDNGASGSNYATGSTNYTDGIAIDGDDNVWVTSSNSVSNSAGAVFELNNTGTNLGTTTGYVSLPATEPDGIAIDGSGNVWYDSFNAASLYELVGAAAPVVTPLASAVANSQLGTRP